MFRPTPFGKYLLLDRISVGGMAEVFKGLYFGVEGFSRQVAIKRILPHLAEDKRFVEMFIDEAKISVQLNHANIAQTIELGRVNDDHFIAMEYVAGKDLLSLHNHVRRNRCHLPVHLAAYIGARVAEGLDYAHRKKAPDGQPLGVIHRDVSPQNVLVSYDGAVKLIDFGIAKVRVRNYQATQAGVLKGKFGYMSPEQIEGAPVDHRSDIFALGTVLHELLTSKRLFFGDNDFATLDLVRRAEAPAPSSLNSEVPASLDAIVAKALARRADDRYATAGELAEALGLFLHTVGSSLSGKALASWMSEQFAEDIRSEKLRDEGYQRLTLGPNGEVIERPAPAMALPEEDEEETALWAPPGDDLSWLPTPGRDQPAHQDSTQPLVPFAAAPTPAVPRRQRGIKLWLLLGALGAAAVVSGVMVFRLLSHKQEGPADLILVIKPGNDLTVFVDEQPAPEQDSPVVVKGLSSGAHQVRVLRRGFAPFEETVVLTEGQRRRHDVELQAVTQEPARIRFVTEPSDARLKVNQRLLTTVERQGDVELPGDREAECQVERVGYWPKREKFTPEAGAKQTITITLEPKLAELTVDSQPPGEVFIDGVHYGRTPRVIKDIDPRKVLRLKVEAPGHHPHTETISFGDQRTLTVDRQLKRR